MQIFNLGLGEIFFVLLIAVVVLGPQRIVSFSRRAGLWMRAMVHNPVWQEVIATSRELREIPNHLMVDTGLQAEIDVLNADLVKVNNNLAEECQIGQDDPSLPPSRVESDGENKMLMESSQ